MLIEQVIGQDDVLPIMAQNIEKFMITHHRSIKVKVHLAMSLNEEIARKLSKDGLHAVLICSDPSKTMTASSIKETLRHLDFDLISLSLFCINVIRPSSITYEIVSEQTEQLSAAYHFTIVNISVEVNIVFKDIFAPCFVLVTFFPTRMSTPSRDHQW